MSEGGGISGIKKLRGSSDYPNWKFLVRNYLENKNWWEVISKDVVNADVDRQARTTICLLLEPECFTHVYNAKTAKEAWNSLQTAYEDKGWGRRIHIQRELFNCKLENFNSMESFISKVTFFAQQLHDIDAGIPEDWIISILLGGLTPEYSPLIMAVDNSGQEITLEQIKMKLLQEGSRQSKMNTDYEQALVTRKGQNDARSTSKTNDRKQKFVYKCFKCHKPGHKASECKERVKTANVCLNTKQAINNDKWYLDSGCSNSMTHDRSKLVSYRPEKRSMKISVANGEKLLVKGRGNAEPQVGENEKLILENVLHVPDLSMNLISVSDLTKKNCSINFDKEGCTIQNKNRIIASCQEVDGIYELTEKKNNVVNVTLSNQNGQNVNITNIWHKRLGHLNRNYMAEMQKIVTGMEFKSSDLCEPCIPCIEGKTCKSPFKNKGTRANEILQIVHSDICGPVEEPSFGGARFVLLFIDDFTRKTHVYFLKHKHETFDKFREYKAEVENETSKSIRVLRSDGGGEYCNGKFKDFLKSAGIKHQTTVPYTPEQNSVAERSHRTIIEKARTLLSEAKLPKQYWAEAVNTVVYLKNRSPTKAVKGAVPEEVWTGKKVDVSHLRIFGCLGYRLIPKAKRRKLDMKTEPMIFIGYPDNQKGYRLMNPKTHEVITARDVIFLEHSFLHKENEKRSEVIINLNTDCDQSSEPQPEPLESHHVYRDAVDDENIVSNPEPDIQQPLPNEMFTEDVIIPDLEERRYPQRERRAVDRYGCNVMYATEGNYDGDPVTIGEALARPDGDLWQKAIDEELMSLKENQTWTLVDLPADKKPIQCKWVFKIKKDSDGKVTKYKARLVAKGFTQVCGVDYTETYSPVVRSSTLRLLFSLAAEYDWFIDQWDVTTAFLYGKIKEDIYMLQPKGAVAKGQETKVCKLQRSLYGLKQASNAWFKELDKEMLNLGFIQSKIEPCLYQKQLKDGKKLIVVIYVDDIFVFGNCELEKQKLKTNLLDKFKVKDLGAARHVLGMRLRREKGVIHLDQEQFILDILNDFNMTDAKPVTTPMEVGLKLERSTSSHCQLPYQSLVGCLNYLACNTRPDISHAVSVLSQFNSCYGEIHFKSAKRVLRYLKGTSNLCLTFRKSGDLELRGYVDADWGGALDRKSFTGLIFKLGKNIVSWESKKQATVSLSSTESEYVGLSQASKEALYLRSLLNSLTAVDGKPVIIFNDNQSAHKIAANKMMHNRTKHIDIKYHFIRECVLANKVEIKYMPTDKMIADILTKSVNGPKLKDFLKDLSLSNYSFKRAD